MQKALKISPPGTSPGQFRARSPGVCKEPIGASQSIGNLSLHQLLASGTIQAKLRLSQPGDADERDADRIADKVVSLEGQKNNSGPSSPPPGRGQPRQSGSIHRKLDRASFDSQHVGGDLLGSLGPGAPMDPQTRALMESRFGQDFSSVRIHDGAAAAQSAESIHARAFTHDHDVVFGSGAYAPHSREGKHLLAHELTHVVQQRGSSTPTVHRSSDQTHTPAKQQQSEPGFFSKLGHGIASAASTVWHGLKAAGRATWKGLKTVGHGIAAAAGAVWSGLKWLGGQLIDKAEGVLERVMNWVARLPVRIVRVVKDLWEAVKALRPWALEWWKSLGHIGTWSGFVKWLGTFLLHLFELGGGGEILETLSEFIKFNTRKLTAQETQAAAKVFGSSINFSLVRIDTHSLLVLVAKKLMHYTKGREFTTFHTINGEEGKIDIGTLIHELTHVWQYQQAGAIYMPQAIHAQGTAEGYDYGDIPGLQAAKAAGRGILNFNREQQAQIVEDFFLIKKKLNPLIGNGTVADLPLYAHFVREVSTIAETDLAKP